MAFMPEDVLNKNFTSTKFRTGYDEHEVDDFLDEIVVELRRLSSENDDLSAQLKACQEDKGVIPPEAQDKIAAARVSAEEAERLAAARIAKANAEAEEAEAAAAERANVAKEAADEIARSAAASVVPTRSQDQEPSQPEVVTPAAAGVGSAAGVLALAQKLHEQYVSEGETTRERLISEGQSHHDQVVGEAAAKQEELLSSGRSKHDELIAEATARHEQMITEARESSTAMVAEAQQKRAEVLQGLGSERSLLQKTIDELRVFERDYRARLKAHLEAQLAELEQTGADESADESADDEGERDIEDGQRYDG